MLLSPVVARDKKCRRFSNGDIVFDLRGLVELAKSSAVGALWTSGEVHCGEVLPTG